MLLNPNETFSSLWSGALRTAICVIIQRENFARKTVSQSSLGNFNFFVYWLSFLNRAKSPGNLQLLFKWKHWITHKSETKNHNNNVMHIVVAENNIFAVRLQKRARELFSAVYIPSWKSHYNWYWIFLLRFEIALGANCCIPSAWKQNIIIPVDKSSSRLHENVISTTKISFLKFEMIARECWRMI